MHLTLGQKDVSKVYILLCDNSPKGAFPLPAPSSLMLYSHSLYSARGLQSCFLCLASSAGLDKLWLFFGLYLPSDSALATWASVQWLEPQTQQENQGDTHTISESPLPISHPLSVYSTISSCLCLPGLWFCLIVYQDAYSMWECSPGSLLSKISLNEKSMKIRSWTQPLFFCFTCFCSYSWLEDV